MAFKRRKLGKKKSRKMFGKSAQKSHRKNYARPMRGGTAI